MDECKFVGYWDSMHLDSSRDKRTYKVPMSWSMSADVPLTANMIMDKMRYVLNSIFALR